MEHGERLAAIAAMWETAAELCLARLAAAPSTKELRDLVYIAETLQDMTENMNGNAGKSFHVCFDDDALLRFAQ